MRWSFGQTNNNIFSTSNITEGFRKAKQYEHEIPENALIPDVNMDKILNAFTKDDDRDERRGERQGESPTKYRMQLQCPS